MIISPKAKEAIDWYSEKRGTYRLLTRKVESIMRDVLESNAVNYHSITGRAKTIESFKEKASSGRYADPRTEIKDMAGVRVITFTDWEAREVTRIVEETFEISPENSIDKAEELGVDRVGYRSVHFVANLGEDRLRLPENSIFKDMRFEIQIRSILQHAWAEFEHDRNYKFKGILPKNIRRRLAVLAGTLELVDREFDSISELIDAYIEEVRDRTERGDLSFPVDSTSVREYMERRFADLMEKGVDRSISKDVIEELTDMGITTLDDLEGIIPKDYIETKSRFLAKADSHCFDSLLGILRDIMMLHDVDGYFEKAWKNKWSALFSTTVYLFSQYGIDLRKHAKRYGFDIVPV